MRVKVVSVKVDDDTKRRMDGLRDLNWSEVVRTAIQRRLEAEEALRKPVDRARAKRAGRAIDRLRQSLPAGDYDLAKEIRKWRDRNLPPETHPWPWSGFSPGPARSARGLFPEPTKIGGASPPPPSSPRPRE